LWKVILALVSTALTILAAEALLRFAEGAPLRIVDGVVLWSTRSPRCDREDIQRAADDSAAFKIVGLGDSIMYGVSEPKEKTYLEQVRRELGRRSSRRVEILNMAVPGYNTIQEYTVYKEIDNLVRPNLVLLHFWEDDAQQYVSDGARVYYTSETSADNAAPEFPVLTQLSHVLLVHSCLYDRLFAQMLLRHGRAASRSESEDWPRTCGALAEIDHRVRSTGGRLLVLASVSLGGAVPEPMGRLSWLRGCAASVGFEVIDLSDWLRGLSASRIAIDGYHFNEEGHRQLGERLADYLLEHDLKE